MGLKLSTKRWSQPKAPECQVQRGLESICSTPPAFLHPGSHQTQARKAFRSPAPTFSTWCKTPLLSLPAKCSPPSFPVNWDRPGNSLPQQAQDSTWQHVLPAGEPNLLPCNFLLHTHVLPSGQPTRQNCSLFLGMSFTYLNTAISAILAP